MINQTSKPEYMLYRICILNKILKQSVPRSTYSRKVLLSLRQTESISARGMRGAQLGSRRPAHSPTHPSKKKNKTKEPVACTVRFEARTNREGYDRRGVELGRMATPRHAMPFPIKG